MDSAKFALWSEADARPPLEYGLLLKLAIYNKLYDQRTGYPIYFTHEAPATCLDFEAHTATLNYQFEFLFDTYWNDLPLLDAMITKFAIPQPYHQRYPASLKSESKSLDLIKDFLYPFRPGPEDALSSDCVYLSKLDYDRQNILKITGDQLYQFTDKLRRLDSKDELYQHNVIPTFPSLLDASLSRRWSSYRFNLENRFKSSLEKTTQDIRSFLDQNRGCQVESHDSEATNEVDLATEIDDITAKSPDMRNIILFAVSGSGKTRSIERVLSRHFGFYFQGCNVPLQTKGLHSAQRNSGSRDTLTLGKMIQYAQEITHQAGAIDEKAWVRKWLFELLSHRQFMLAIFLGVAKELAVTPELLPRLWYNLQVNDEYDIFDEGFQLLCLLDERPTNNSEISDSANQMLKHKQMYYCLDEAQGDIDTRIHTSDGTTSLLSVWAEELSAISHNWGLIGEKRYETIHPLIYSGTSLRTTDAVKAISFEGHLPHFSGWRECCVLSSFPLIRDDEQFKTAMSKHGLRDVVQGGEKDGKVLLGLIVQHAKPLYGRPAWSVRYLERVKRLLRQDCAEGMMEEIFREASNETVNEVKDNLKERLQELHLEGQNRLVEDLCRVVVWSDLTDRPTHFWDDTGPKMIEQAFAVMRKISNRKPSKRRQSVRNPSKQSLPDEKSSNDMLVGKQPSEANLSEKRPSDGNDSDEISLYMLQERLALDAAKEYIMTARSDLVERYLGQYLQEHANTSGDYGKPAEFFLAWSLNRAFVDDAKRLSGSSEVNRSTRLLEALSSNQKLLYPEEPLGGGKDKKQSVEFDTNDDQPCSLDLSGYTLVRGIKTGHTFDRTVPLVDWMNDVRRSIEEPGTRPNSMFYFPEESAGPDLMFALHKKSLKGGDEVVLCVLQLKCGGAELEKGIIRTDLSNAYRSKKGILGDRYSEEQYKALEKELKAWSAPDPGRVFRILRVLVTAAVQPAAGDLEPVVVRGTPCVEYFVRCDARQTELLFGSGFKVLLDSLRSTDESLSAIYAKVNCLPATKRLPLEERKKDIVSVFEGSDDDEMISGLFNES